MALLFQEPFESGLTGWTLDGTSGNWTTVAGRTGNCIQVASSGDHLWRAFGTDGATATLGFAFQVSALWDDRPLASFWGDGYPFTEHVTLVSSANGSLRVCRGGAFGALLGVSAVGLIAINTWNFVELQATLSDTVGAVQVKLNGTPVIGPLTGLDTKNGGTKTVFDTVVLRAYVGGTTTKFDDLYLRNDSTFGTTPPVPAPTWFWRPFVVRRTTGGDVLRSSEGYRGALRLGAGVVTPEEVAGTNLIVYPRFYDSMVITVQVPRTIAWEQAVLVRGGFGAPTTPQDGVAIWYLVEDEPHATDLSQMVIDTPLTPDNWYYYSLFLWVEGQWVRVMSMDNIVPKHHGWAEFLFTTLPMFYQRSDDQQAADGRNGPLRTFARTLGYELDYTNTLADGVRDVYNVDKAPTRLLKHLGYNFGVPDEPVLGDTRQRSMLQQLSDLNALRGTALGLKQLIQAATHYSCDIATSGNQLLSVDDGDFNGGDVSQPGMAPLLSTDLGWGIGHWVPMLNSTVLAEMEDPNNAGTFASSHTVTTAILAKNTNTAVLPAGGTGSMVVNGHGPDTVIACGTLLNDASVQYGIPVTPGALYSFSCQVKRTTTGPASEQPPSARIVLALLWFDAAGTFRGASTGPPPPGSTDGAAWTASTVAAFAPTVAVDTYDARFAIPAIWWISTTWAGASDTPTVRPTYGRYVSMASFNRVAAAGSGITTVGPDVFLTLGVAAKKLAGPESLLGVPGGTT